MSSYTQASEPAMINSSCCDSWNHSTRCIAGGWARSITSLGKNCCRRDCSALGNFPIATPGASMPENAQLIASLPKLS
eukprot:3059650-Pyramimonas_sp.AAC.1